MPQMSTPRDSWASGTADPARLTASYAPVGYVSPPPLLRSSSSCPATSGGIVEQVFDSVYLYLPFMFCEVLEETKRYPRIPRPAAPLPPS
jgi:hypothetical protein